MGGDWFMRSEGRREDIQLAFSLPWSEWSVEVRRGGSLCDPLEMEVGGGVREAPAGGQVVCQRGGDETGVVVDREIGFGEVGGELKTCSYPTCFPSWSVVCSKHGTLVENSSWDLCKE